MFSQKKFSIKRNACLKKYSSFNIGGKADYLITVKNKEELIQAVKEIKKKNISFFILGGGSNVLFSDKNFKGVVLRIENKNINIEKENIINVEAGTRLSDLVSFCLNKGLSGLEWAAGIPGTTGGAIRGNAAAFRKSIKDSIISVKVYDIGKDEIKIIGKKNCEFGYRDSLFKKKEKYAILEAKMRLKKKKKDSIKKEIKFFLEQRKQKQPPGFSAGSVFKNYEIKNKKEKEFLLKKFPEFKKIIVSNMIPAAFLIERCGLKGKKVGGAIISEIHSNFIINLGKAKSSDVKKIIKIIKKEVKKNFKIALEEEIVVVK